MFVQEEPSRQGVGKKHKLRADVSSDSKGSATETVKKQAYVPLDSTQLYLHALGRFPVFTREEELSYARKLRQGEFVARQKLLEHNLRLVVKIALDYRHSRLSLLELISEGNLGLFYAVEKFDPELGYKFSTYASNWVRQSIERSILLKQNIVHTPYRHARTLRKLQKAQWEYLVRCGETATLQQLADNLDCSVAEADFVATLDFREYSIETDKSESGIELPADRPGPEGEVQQQQMEVLLLRLVKELPQRQQALICLRFGLLGNRAHTLREIAAIMSFSRERVRLLLNQALTRMRRELEQRGLNTQQIFYRADGSSTREG